MDLAKNYKVLEQFCQALLEDQAWIKVTILTFLQLKMAQCIWTVVFTKFFLPNKRLALDNETRPPSINLTSGLFLLCLTDPMLSDLSVDAFANEVICLTPSKSLSTASLRIAELSDTTKSAKENQCCSFAKKVMFVLSLRFNDCCMEALVLVGTFLSPDFLCSRNIWAFFRLLWKPLLSGHYSVDETQWKILYISVAILSAPSRNYLWNVSLD